MKNIFATNGFNPMRSKGRAVLHRELLPKLAGFLKSGDTVVNVGTHIFWDYSAYFFNPSLMCNYITTDTQVDLKDQQEATTLKYMIDDITHSSLADNSVDCLLFIGMHDNINNPKAAYGEIMRILRPGGRLLVAFPGSGAQCGGELVGALEWANWLTGFIVDEVHYVYDPENDQRYTDGKNTSIIVLARKPNGTN